MVWDPWSRSQLQINATTGKYILRRNICVLLHLVRYGRCLSCHAAVVEIRMCHLEVWASSPIHHRDHCFVTRHSLVERRARYLFYCLFVCLFFNLDIFCKAASNVGPYGLFLAACPCTLFIDIISVCLLIGQIKMLACLLKQLLNCRHRLLHIIVRLHTWPSPSAFTLLHLEVYQIASLYRVLWNSKQLHIHTTLYKIVD